ncbi:hypothetical protein D0Y65_048636 [Glycine soja]|uniref:Uncharacterized protein n=1 Tax=Glycine soja TaxID=3848 RepID=A0A445FTP0_GLYSO|nr:hypothetical protein D0Y65_048636 [Glycine soja]
MMGRGRPPKKKIGASDTKISGGFFSDPEARDEEIVDEVPKEFEPEKPNQAESQDEGRKLWVDVLKDNRNLAKGRAMKFIAPQVVDGKIEVLIEDDDIRSEVKFWESSLILYAMGADLSMNAVKNFMTRSWNFVQLPDMYFNDEGNIPLLIREWRPGFKIKDELLRTLPIWVKLPQLPIILWGDTSLNKIGSALGNPIMTDECTANRLRVSYARILVEMDITNELPQTITIADNEGEKIQQAIEYEWRPLFCNKCQKVGHSCDKPKVRKQWKPKQVKQSVANVEFKKEEVDDRWSNAVGNDNNVKVKTSMDIASTSAETPSPVAEDIRNKDVEAVVEKWIEVIRSGRERGKKKVNDSSTGSVLCDNGFDALEILKDLIEFQNTGQ